jgi:hypothetical protein
MLRKVYLCYPKKSHLFLGFFYGGSEYARPQHKRNTIIVTVSKKLAIEPLGGCSVLMYGKDYMINETSETKRRGWDSHDFKFFVGVGGDLSQPQSE